MKRDAKKALYESIMTSVAREVKKVLNENKVQNNKPALEDLLFDIMKKFNNGEIVVRDQQNMKDAIYFITNALSTDKQLNANIVKLYAGNLINGIFSYKDKLISIKCIEQPEYSSSLIKNVFFVFYPFFQ